MNELTTTNNALAQSGIGQVSMQSREVAEIQSQMVIAKNFPRDEKRVFDFVLTDCQRQGLAVKALYCYSRGGSEISGASIHLAKSILRRWGNARSGITELERKNGESVCEAYCIDLESNYRESKVFTVKHFRDTKRGAVKLESDRDIYELIANMGARRERACILAILPPDLVEEASNQCGETLRTTIKITAEIIKKMVDAFGEFGVSKEQIEGRIQRRIETIAPAQMVSLRNIYNSLKDGMSKPADWFEVEMPKSEKKGMDALKEKIEKIPETLDNGATQGELPIEGK